MKANRLLAPGLVLFAIAVLTPLPSGAQPVPPWHWPPGEVLAPSSAETGGAGPEELLETALGSSYDLVATPFAGTPLLTSFAEPAHGQPIAFYGVLLDPRGAPGDVLSFADAPVSGTVPREFVQLTPRTVLNVLVLFDPELERQTIAAQIFDAEGPWLERPLPIDQQGHSGNWNSGSHSVRASACADGSFAVAWTRGNEGQLYARAYDAEIAPLGGEILLSRPDGPPRNDSHDIACGPDGWMVAWIDRTGALELRHLDRQGRATTPRDAPAFDLGRLGTVSVEGGPGGWVVGVIGHPTDPASDRPDEASGPREIHAALLAAGGEATGELFRIDSSQITTLDSGPARDLPLAIADDHIAAAWGCLEGPYPGVGETVTCQRTFVRRDGRVLPLEAPSPILPASFAVHDRYLRLVATSEGFLSVWRHLPEPLDLSRSGNPLWRRFTPRPSTDLFPLTDGEVTCLARHALGRVPAEPEDGKSCKPVELTDEDADRAAWLLSLFEARAAAEDGGICSVALHRTAGIDSFRLHATAGDGSRLTADVRMIFRQSGELDGLRLTSRPACPAVAEGEPYPLDCSLPDNDGRLPRLSVSRQNQEDPMRALQIRPGRAVYLEAERLPSRSERKATNQASSSSRLGHSSGSGEFP